jgi:hypothetical protein
VRATAPPARREDRSRPRLYETARKLNIPGRSKPGKRDLIDAIRARRGG